MEVYILDNLLRREQVVDSFESLIWTERWNKYGDFELQLPSTLTSRGQFIPGTRLAMNDSYRVMTVETVEDSTDEEGLATLKVKGRSLEALFEDRIVKSGGFGPINGDAGSIVFAGIPSAIVQNLFNTFIVNSPFDPADKMPFYQSGGWLPIPNIPFPSESVTWKGDIDTVYKFMTEICEMYELGFRLVRRYDTSQLYFDVYTGNDLTSSQTILKPVIFAPNLDNLQNTNELLSIQGTKNVAYVFNEFGSLYIYPSDVVNIPMGFERRVLLVKTDAPPDGVENNAHLAQTGLQELAKNRASSVFDGEMNQRGVYKYGVDYNLGDKVEMRNADGLVTIRRVTEQIFVSDTEGERSYPTLSASAFTGTDTWLYRDSKTWSDLTDYEMWANQ